MRKIIASILIVLIGLILAWFVKDRSTASIIPSASGTILNISTAAPGRIEGLNETINLGVAATGLIQDVLVKTGDSVKRGQLLAHMECNDLIAELPQRVAEYEAASAVFDRVKRGNRPEDIATAEADLELSRARLVEAKATNDRVSNLVPKGGATVAQATTAERDFNVAEAQLKISESRLALMRIGSRVEDIEEARAKVEASKQIVQLTKARLARCDIRSPIDGLVLRKGISEGELVTIYSPSPLFLLAPTDRYRVRAEVDEYDIDKVGIGQLAEVVLGPPSNRKLNARVTELGKAMGRRRILTNDAADKSDRDVLEVLLDLENHDISLPVGLRVAVIFLKDDRQVVVGFPK